MVRPKNRAEALARLRGTLSRGEPIVGAGAGVGLSAKSTEAGGIDLVIVYNSGRYRMAGRGSLAGLMPYGDANQVVLEMANEVLPVVRDTPVLAGVCSSDPFRDVDALLDQLKDLGFAGVQNFPTCGLVDSASQFRRGLEETGMGYDTEVRMVKSARSRELLTTPYVFNKDEARQMAEAGADILVAHMGLTTSGSIGATSGKTLDECVSVIKEIEAEARNVNDEIILLCHGGPIAMPKDAQYIMSRIPGVQGFYGASSMERLPVEEAIKNTTRDFKQLRAS